MSIRIGVGLIGTGFMGKCHALAYNNVHAVFASQLRPELALLCDLPAAKATEMAKQFGFARATDDWRSLVQDPAVDIVSITTPNKFHHAMAIAAIQAGKHVYCEKPLALTLNEAREMHEAAKRSNVKSMVGYNYLHNPAFIHARKLISQGAIGRVIHFRGQVDEDYQADPDLAWTWRSTKASAGLGALGDLGCHLVSLAYNLVGPIKSLIADKQTVYKQRPVDGSDEFRTVENEDIASALVQFENGVQGVLCTSRAAWGRKNHLSFEVHGDVGMLCFDQERMNELRLYQNTGDAASLGFRTILSGPEHPPYANFCPAPGHGLGFGDLKVIELAGFLEAIANDKKPYPDFTDALEFEKVIHAIDIAAETGKRVQLAEL